MLSTFVLAPYFKTNVTENIRVAENATTWNSQ